MPLLICNSEDKLRYSSIAVQTDHMPVYLSTMPYTIQQGAYYKYFTA